MGAWRLAWICDKNQRRTAPGEIHPDKNFGFLMTLNPFGDPSIGFLWGLPEKSVGLSLENSRLRFRNTIGENGGLLDVVGADYIAIPYNHKGGNYHIAQPVRGFPIAARNYESKILFEFGML